MSRTQRDGRGLEETEAGGTKVFGVTFYGDEAPSCFNSKNDTARYISSPHGTA